MRSRPAAYLRDVRTVPEGAESEQEPKSETDRKLDALDELSENLRRRKLRSRAGRSGRRRVKQKKDW